MNIKAQGLLNAAKWIEEEYGTDALRDIVRACSPEVRDRYTSAIAINWHPLEELVEFLDVADRMLGRGDGKIAEEIGAAGARSNMKGAMLRLAFYLGKPDFLMRRITNLWRQFNDEGSMELLHLDEFSSAIEVKGIGKPHWLFCCTLTGWARQVSASLGGANTIVRHTDCRARGGAHCLWQLRWSGMGVSEVAQASTPSAHASSGSIRAARIVDAPRLEDRRADPRLSSPEDRPPSTRKRP